MEYFIDMGVNPGGRFSMRGTQYQISPSLIGQNSYTDIMLNMLATFQNA